MFLYDTQVNREHMKENDTLIVSRHQIRHIYYYIFSKGSLRGVSADVKHFGAYCSVCNYMSNFWIFTTGHPPSSLAMTYSSP